MQRDIPLVLAYRKQEKLHLEITLNKPAITALELIPMLGFLSKKKEDVEAEVIEEAGSERRDVHY